MADYVFRTSQGPNSPQFIPQKTHSEGSAYDTGSQQLSFTTSNSQSSEKRRSSSGQHELSQGSGTKTPSTSLSDWSSQEYVSMDGIEDEEGGAVSGLDMEKHFRSKNLLATEPSKDRVYHTSAPKRMYDGKLKSPKTLVPINSIRSEKYGHSRDSSRTSRSSQVSELSSELKTRLSYAMVKVQNGWQSQTISDLEVLTSNQNSPNSEASEQGRLPALPRGSKPPTEFPYLMQASVHASRMTAKSEDSPQKEVLSAVRGRHPQALGPHRNSICQIGSAYESFWREHEGNAPSATQAINVPPGSLSLAPPLDIIPRRSRTLDATNQALPLSKPQPCISPKTPSPKKPSTLRTPSQQAAVEKDAVETLLFMSSPNNSGYYPRLEPAKIPPKGLLVSNTKDSPRLGSLPHGNFGDSASHTSSLKQQSISRDVLTEACVDRELDETPDTSSSDEGNPQIPQLQSHEHARR